MIDGPLNRLYGSTLFLEFYIYKYISDIFEVIISLNLYIVCGSP